MVRLKPCPFNSNSEEYGSSSLPCGPGGKDRNQRILVCARLSGRGGELRAGSGALGMSYEITDAIVVSPASPIWTVTSFTFTGAAVLRRERAAYPETWIAIGETNRLNWRLAISKQAAANSEQVKAS